MNTANIILRPIKSEYNRRRGNYRELRLFFEAKAGEELDEHCGLLVEGEVFLSCHVRSLCQQTCHGVDPEWGDPELQTVRIDAPPDLERGYGKLDTLDLAEAREIAAKLLAISTWTHGMTSLEAVLEGLLAYAKPERIFYTGPTDYRKECGIAKILSDVKSFEAQLKPAQQAVQRVFGQMLGV